MSLSRKTVIGLDNVYISEFLPNNEMHDTLRRGGWHEVTFKQAILCDEGGKSIVLSQRKRQRHARWAGEQKKKKKFKRLKSPRR